jgi:hypothetical protein
VTAYLYAAIALVGAVLGGLLTHLYDGGRYSHLEVDYANYKTTAASQLAGQQALVRAALQKQVDDAHRIAQENDSALADLHAKLDESDRLRASDRATVRSLLSDAAQACPSGDRLPKAADQPGGPKPGGKVSVGQLGDACADLAAEDAHNADRLDTLITEIRGQL